MNLEQIQPLEKTQSLDSIKPHEITELIEINAMDVHENMETPPGRENVSKAHATTMNGVRIHHESYGIFGEMIINRNDVKVFGGDEIFVTAEPKNLAPLEFLTYYVKDKAPSLWVYDWGRPATDRWKYIASLGDNNFINDFTHVKTTPNNDKVRVVVFQNYYNEKFDCNMVDLLHTNGKFINKYASLTKGKPAAPSASPSGWSVLEYKRLIGTKEPWAKIPFMLGIANIFIKDKSGNWYKPKAADTYVEEGSTQYKRVFWNNDGSAYKG